MKRKRADGSRAPSVLWPIVDDGVMAAELSRGERKYKGLIAGPERNATFQTDLGAQEMYGKKDLKVDVKTVQSMGVRQTRWNTQRCQKGFKKGWESKKNIRRGVPTTPRTQDTRLRDALRREKASRGLRM
jgi:hypothetical protein